MGRWKMAGTCKAVGEIDMATAAAFRADLFDVIDNSEEALVSVDCSGVTFMDSAAYHTLIEATEYAERRGHTLVIRNLSPSCARLIRLCIQSNDLSVESFSGARREPRGV
jgi:anti-anti-sigma factor